MQGTPADSWQEFAEELRDWLDDPPADYDEYRSQAQEFAAKAAYLASTA